MGLLCYCHVSSWLVLFWNNPTPVACWKFHLDTAYQVDVVGNLFQNIGNSLWKQTFSVKNIFLILGWILGRGNVCMFKIGKKVPSLEQPRDCEVGVTALIGHLPWCSRNPQMKVKLIDTTNELQTQSKLDPKMMNSLVFRVLTCAKRKWISQLQTHSRKAVLDGLDMGVLAIWWDGDWISSFSFFAQNTKVVSSFSWTELFCSPEYFSGA